MWKTEKRNQNLHGCEEFSVFIITFVFIDKRIELVDELILNGPERSTYSLKLESSFQYYFIHFIFFDFVYGNSLVRIESYRKRLLGWLYVMRALEPMLLPRTDQPSME